MRLSATRQFSATVVVNMPWAEGQPAAEPLTFVGHFRALTTDDFQQHDMASIEGQSAYLRQVFLGWEGVIDDTDGEDKPLKFSTEARDVLIRDFFVRQALLGTYAEALGGAKRGN